MLKSKFIRIAVAGDTTDGRVIEESWLTQMAESYDPKKYTAQIDCEHYKGFSPESDFANFGQVLALKTGMFKVDNVEKLALYAQLKPNSKLLALNEKGQKLFTSMEVNPSFSNSNSAYLVGLAVTDDPASLGTEMLQFSASAEQSPLAKRKQHQDNLFSVANEVDLEFEDIEEDTSTNFVARIKSMFKRNKQQQDSNNDDMYQAIEAVATEVVEHRAETEQKLCALEEIESRFTALANQFDEFKKRIESTDFNSQRPPVDGGDGKIQTDY